MYIKSAESNKQNTYFLFRQVINQTMEVDIPQYANMNASRGRKLKKLLAVIAFGLLY